MNKQDYLKKKIKRAKTYAGEMCPKCNKGINNETPIHGFEEYKAVQRKRYDGARLCNECLENVISRGEKLLDQ